MSSEPVSVDYVDQAALNVAAIVDDERRRAVLAVLADAPQPLSEAALGRAVAVRTAEGAPAELTDGVVQAVRVDLHHRDLPKLADCELVDRDDDGTARLTERGREVARRLRADDDACEVLGAGDGQGRLPVLVPLATLAAPVALETLADAIVDDHESWDDAESVAIYLHHVALPRLEDAGILAYDADERLVEGR